MLNLKKEDIKSGSNSVTHSCGSQLKLKCNTSLNKNNLALYIYIYIYQTLFRKCQVELPNNTLNILLH